MDKATVISDNTSGVVSVGQTLTGSTGFSWNTVDTDGRAGADFGGGTVTLYYRPKRLLSNAENPWIFLDTPAENEQAMYSVGQNMDIGLEVSGASSPAFAFLIGQIA